MRMSCNGCRILRKGCSDNCSIRPCLQWIKSPESQANATMFLAKFYGRAGLTNLINAGPEHLHPAIFRSLLYEACGRIVNPIYGSVGLLWSGNWQLCQAAVEAVLNGTPITPITSETAVIGDGPPLKAYDIRHVSKDDKSAASNDLHRTKSSYRFKHSGRKSKPSRAAKPQPKLSPEAEPNRSTSHESALSHQSEPVSNLDGDSKEIESMVSEDTAEPLLLFSFRDDSESAPEQTEEVECSPDIGLELSLGLEPMTLHAPQVVPVKKRRLEEFGPTESDACKRELGV